MLNICKAQHIEHTHVIKIDQTDGLSSYNIRRIYKDKSDFLWIGTQFGLSRFDGKNFLNYAQNGHAEYQLCGVDVRGIAEDAAMLWILPGGFGFDGINLKTFRVDKTERIAYDGIREYGLSLTSTPDRLWLGSSSGLRIYDKKTGQFTTLAKNADVIPKGQYFNVRCLFTDPKDNVWAFYTGYGIEIFNGKTGAKIRRIPISAFSDQGDGNNKLRFINCVNINNDRLLIGTTEGLREISYDSDYRIRIDNNPVKNLDSLNHHPIEGLCRLSTGKVMISSLNQLFCFDATFRSYTIWKDSKTAVEGDWLSSVQYIFADKKDNIWLGCQQGLAYIPNRQNPFQSYFFDPTGGLKLDHVRSLFPTDKGDLIVGLRNGTVKIDQNTGNFEIIDQTQLCHHIFQHPDGTLIFCRSNGPVISGKEGFEPITLRFPEFQAFTSYPINSYLQIDDSTAVLGTENSQGILIWDQAKHSIQQITTHSQPALQSDIVNNIYRDRNERLWVLSDHNITILSNKWKVVKNLRIEDKVRSTDINPFFDVCEANGFYWLAAYGTGIIQMDSTWNVRKIYNTDAGLSNNGVYQIFHSGNTLIITTDNGLSVFDLNAGKFKRYFIEDGLHSNAFEEVAATMKDGLIYAGGVQGFTVIDPSKFSINTVPPKIYINRIVVDRADKHAMIDTTNLELKLLDIPSDVLQTRFYFSGINYSDPKRTTFAYRIREKGNWTDNGTDNSVSLIGLAPGTYHFEVKAANEDGVWSEPTVLTLVYLPKWYQTWWFKTLLCLAALSAGYGFYRLRINQILKQHQIRREVASDLHDDIGSSLNSVKVFAHLAGTNPSRKEYIRNVEENLEQATIGLRDMIWILDDKLDSVGDLCGRLSQLSARPAEAIGIVVKFNIGEGLQNRILLKPVKRNLFLIAKEAINNSVKYAQCKNIHVRIAEVQKKLTMTISDDGIGFDTESATAGYGLNNMRSRADQMHFNYVINSSPFGTRITISQK